MSAIERQYATIDNPSISAIVTGSYSFADRAKAVERLELTHKFFVTAKKTHKAPDGGPGFLIWIKGFGVTPEESAQGILGNFAHIFLEKKDNGRHTLVAHKLAQPVQHHPMRNRPKQSHPDWGHPIMRAIKKQKRFDSVEAAQSELTRLHEAFPDATIPNPGKLHIMVYERSETKDAPIQKYVFEIQLTPENDYMIEFTKKKKAPSLRNPATTEATDKQSKGYFTQMVELKRAKKKPKNPRMPKIKPQPAGND